MEDQSAPQRDYTISAVDRALRLLEALGEAPNEGVSVLARRLGLTKSIVFRLLVTLEQRGFVDRDPDRGTYSLGHRIGVLGERLEPGAGLLAAARPVMERLRDQTAESVNLVVREGARSLVLATRAGHHAIRLFAQAGRYGPLHAGGGSMVLLAFAPVAIRTAVASGPLERFTPETITDGALLLERLEQIRRDGFNVVVSDLDLGAFSISAPIRTRGGEVVAALSVAGAEVRLSEGLRPTYLAAVLGAAEEISRKLGVGGESRARNAPV
jgi:IclR family KDG regulon transcriptional repressor